MGALRRRHGTQDGKKYGGISGEASLSNLVPVKRRLTTQLNSGRGELFVFHNTLILHCQDKLLTVQLRVTAVMSAESRCTKNHNTKQVSATCWKVFHCYILLRDRTASMMNGVVLQSPAIPPNPLKLQHHTTQHQREPLCNKSLSLSSQAFCFIMTHSTSSKLWISHRRLNKIIFLTENLHRLAPAAEKSIKGETSISFYHRSAHHYVFYC